MHNIILYKNKSGKSEVLEYLLKLKNSKDKSSRIKFNKIVAYINMLKKYGTSLGEPYIKHLDAEIWELRPSRNRILFAYYDNNKFVLLNLFMKKTRKTPKSEIEKAQRYLKDLKKRSKVL